MSIYEFTRLSWLILVNGTDSTKFMAANAPPIYHAISSKCGFPAGPGHFPTLGDRNLIVKSPFPHRWWPCQCSTGKIEHPQICCKYHQISAALYEKMPQKRAFCDMSDILGHPSGTSPNKPQQTDDLGSGKKLVAKDGHGAVLGIRVLGFPSSDCHLLFQWGNHRTKRCLPREKSSK
jgi:hypothetical protein